MQAFNDLVVGEVTGIDVKLLLLTNLADRQKRKASAMLVDPVSLNTAISKTLDYLLFTNCYHFE